MQDIYKDLKVPALRILLFILMFAAALSVRLYRISCPPLDFHPIRQYHSAIIARGYYYEHSDLISEHQKQIARINFQRESSLEPRILETITFLFYTVFKGEHLWIPRSMSSLFWVIGGVFLSLIVRDLFSVDAALFSGFFYLFMPFGIIASRSFQPDPMMVMLVMASVYSMLKYSRRASVRRLIIAAILSSLPILVKPICFFHIFGAFLGLQIGTRGVWRTIVNWHFLIFAGLTILPGTLYYVFARGLLSGQASISFLPHMLLESYFWKGWLVMVAQVTGLIPFVFAMIAFFVFPKRSAKFLFAGLLTGNFFMGMIFNYQIHTHNYYQLVLVPIIAFALGPICVFIIRNRVQLYMSISWKLIVAIVVPMLLLLTIMPGSSAVRGKSWMEVPLKDRLSYVANFFWLERGYMKTLYSDFSDTVSTAKEIGRIVNHSSRTIILSQNSGFPIKYHGEIAGEAWPSTGDFHAFQKIHKTPVAKANIAEYFNKICDNKAPEYFIITDFEELAAQSDLKKHLDSNFPILARDTKFLIYDLRGVLHIDVTPKTI